MDHRLVAASTALSFALIGCGSVAGGPPSPTPSPPSTATPTATSTPTPTPTPTGTPTPPPPAATRPAPPPTPANTAPVLKMVGGAMFAFSPTSLTIRHGVALTVTNTTAAPHTVTADGGAFDSGVVNPNSSTTITFSTPATYPFHCRFHPYMTGTLTVT